MAIVLSKQANTSTPTTGFQKPGWWLLVFIFWRTLCISWSDIDIHLCVDDEFFKEFLTTTHWHYCSPFQRPYIWASESPVGTLELVRCWSLKHSPGWAAPWLPGPGHALLSSSVWYCWCCLLLQTHTIILLILPSGCCVLRGSDEYILGNHTLLLFL